MSSVAIQMRFASQQSCQARRCTLNSRSSAISPKTLHVLKAGGNAGSLSIASASLHVPFAPPAAALAMEARSEEHTSELQSLMRISYAVFCLKKKTRKQTTISTHNEEIQQ